MLASAQFLRDAFKISASTSIVALMLALGGGSSANAQISPEPTGSGSPSTTAALVAQYDTLELEWVSGNERIVVRLALDDRTWDNLRSDPLTESLGSQALYEARRFILRS